MYPPLQNSHKIISSPYMSPILHLFYFLSPQQPLVCLLSPSFFLSRNWCEIKQYVFSDWLLELRNKHFLIILIFVWFCSWYLIIAQKYSIVWFSSLSICLPVEEHLDCFQFRESINKVCLHIGMQISLWTWIFKWVK